MSVAAIQPAGDVRETVIGPSRGWGGLGWAEIVRYRELLYLMVWRDFTVRYRQTSLGLAWAIVQPAVTMLIFTLIFGRVAGIRSDGFPYPLFVLAGLLPWTFFSSGVTAAAGSLVSQQHLLTKIYFPRLFVPTTVIGTCLVDFAVSCMLCAGVMAWYHQPPTVGVLAVPLLLLGTTVATLGMGYLLAALTVTYRDLRFAVPFFIQAMTYISPVVYATSAVPSRWRPAMAVNPMYGFIEGFRAALLGTPCDYQTVGISALSATALLFLGVVVFRKTEGRFADIA